MDAEQLSQALYDKMEAEFNEYKSNMLQQAPEQILKQAYEYTVREDILMATEYIELSVEQLEALLSSPSPLEEIFNQFQSLDINYMDTLRNCIEIRADDLLVARQEATRFIPLYPHSGEYAREHGEIDAFRASRKENEACKKAIEAAIREGYDGMHLTADTKGVLAEFGPERVTYVLAATIQNKGWDERFSRSNKAWAAAVPMFEAENRRSAYVVNSHSTLLNGYVGMMRKELDAVRKQPKQASERPSIKEQLTAKSVPGGKPAKPREQEAR